MAEAPALWVPWPGPQTAFCGSTEFEVLFGGAKGPGKSDAILFGSTAQVQFPKYKALILRATFPELQELIDRSHAVFPHMENPPKWNASLKRWIWPSGAQTVFGYCSKLEDVERYHGQEYPYIGFDELGNLLEERVWERLMAECRCPDPRVIRMMRASANPGGPGHPWLKRRFIDKCGKQGETVYQYQLRLANGQAVSLSRRYIPARVTDNPVYAHDPLYMAQLQSLPDVLRRQLLEGDWDAGTGVALDELDRQRHLVPSFEVPKHWLQFGAFDWGFTHPFVFGWFAVADDQTVYLIDTIRGRRLYDEEIFDRIANRLDISKISYTVAGHDCWSDYKAMRRDGTPNTAERFTDLGLPLAKANINRPVGLQNLRHYLAWRTPQGEKAPRFYLMDTPENRRTFDCLESMVVDPDNMEDALKLDSDPLTGEGGDDAYDMVRYGLASRPPPVDALPDTRTISAFDRDVLEHEQEQRRHTSGDTRVNQLLFDGWVP